MPTKPILILFAHPAFQKSRANRILLDQVIGLDGITFHDLYEHYPDFNIDVKREQQLLQDHQTIVLHHPFYWYSAPAIIKEWLDLVLEYNFAYGPEGTALSGKALLTVITTGGGSAAYHSGGHNRYTIRQFLAPFEQTANLCNMTYLPPYVVHGMNSQAEEQAIQKSARDYAHLLGKLRDGALDDDELHQAVFLNDFITEDHGGSAHA